MQQLVFDDIIDNRKQNKTYDFLIVFQDLEICMKDDALENGVAMSLQMLQVKKNIQIYQLNAITYYFIS